MHDNDVDDDDDDDDDDEVGHRMIVKCMHARGRIRFH